MIACNKMTANARSSIRKALKAGRSVNSRFDPVSSLHITFCGHVFRKMNFVVKRVFVFW